jgi:hypothetical protein
LRLGSPKPLYLLFDVFVLPLVAKYLQRQRLAKMLVFTQFSDVFSTLQEVQRVLARTRKTAKVHQKVPKMDLPNPA